MTVTAHPQRTFKAQLALVNRSQQTTRSQSLYDIERHRCSQTRSGLDHVPSKRESSFPRIVASAGKEHPPDSYYAKRNPIGHLSRVLASRSYLLEFLEISVADSAGLGICHPCAGRRLFPPNTVLSALCLLCFVRHPFSYIYHRTNHPDATRWSRYHHAPYLRTFAPALSWPLVQPLATH